MGREKKHIAYVILIGFLLAITPRSFVHDCHEFDGHDRHEESSHYEVKEDCDFCSYDIGDICSWRDVQFFSAKVFLDAENDIFLGKLVNLFSLPLFFRGPPVC